MTDTGIPPLGVPSFNDQLAVAITQDGDNDGLLDLSLMMLLRPFDPLASGDDIADLTSGDCTVPPATTCAPMAGNQPATTTYMGLAAGVCQDPIPGTTSGYTPAPPSPLAPCMVSAPVDATVDLGGTLVPLRDATIAATFTGNPPTGLIDGVLRGFLRETDADAVQIDPSIPFIGGQPLSSILPGGTNSCASHDDRDELDGVSGWWMYLELTGEVVPWTGS